MKCSFTFFNIRPKLRHWKWRKLRVTMPVNMHALFSVRSLRDDNVITSKPTWKLKHSNSIPEYFEYFCQMSSKSILTVLSYTVSKLVRFLRHDCNNCLTEGGRIPKFGCRDEDSLQTKRVVLEQAAAKQTMKDRINYNRPRLGRSTTLLHEIRLVEARQSNIILFLFLFRKFGCRKVIRACRVQR